MVGLHAPLLPETRGAVGARLLNSLTPGATLVNTARGALIDEGALAEVLRARADLTAVLDVTHPEPPARDSPLFTLPNVVLTPHLAGALGAECHRLRGSVARTSTSKRPRWSARSRPMCPSPSRPTRDR
ncbi:NAD(P)-dependent oxidoreductase [Streptomyces sp. NPDC003032]